MTIPLTDDLLNEARAMSDYLLSIREFKDGGNYTGLETDDRWYWGYVGELVFFEFCKEYNLDVVWDNSILGKSDHGDFHINTNSGYDVRVDVKTCTNPKHKMIMLPDAQWQIKVNDLYVAVRIMDDCAQVLGCCRHMDFKLKQEGFTSAKVPTRYTELDSLDKIESKMRWYRTGETKATKPSYYQNK